MEPSKVLDLYLGYLTHWLVSDLNMPRWDNVYLTESIEDGPLPTEVRVNELMLYESYRDRFTELASAGFPWININVVGISNGRLILHVELPARQNPHVTKTSVNMNGPIKAVTENGFVVKIL